MTGYVAYHDDTVVVVDRRDSFLIEWAGTDRWMTVATRGAVTEELARRGNYAGALAMVKYGKGGQ
jgi:hypothetical protein